MLKKTKEVNWTDVAEQQNITRRKLAEVVRLRVKFNRELDVQEVELQTELRKLNNKWDKCYV